MPGNRLTWPDVPDPKGVVTYDEATDTVTMPLSYWKKIVGYVSDIETNIEILKWMK